MAIRSVTVTAMRAPANLTTERLRLRKPTMADAPAIFARYAGDFEVTRHLSWPRHASVEDTAAFLRWSEQVWSTHSAGPYLILDSAGTVVGSTGLDIETPQRAATGYVLAGDTWGRGYATEAAVAMVQLPATYRSVGCTRSAIRRTERRCACCRRPASSSRTLASAHRLPEP